MAMMVGKRKGIMAEMNVVPLIDVLLVLLIIFMVITPLTPKGLEARIPQQSDEPTRTVKLKPRWFCCPFLSHLPVLALQTGVSTT